MTEKEAWLELAKMFGPGKPMPLIFGCGTARVVGICHGITCLRVLRRIGTEMANGMNDHLYEYFVPQEYREPPWPYFWPANIRRTSRTLRATACCFLAAMCND